MLQKIWRMAEKGAGMDPRVGGAAGLGLLGCFIGNSSLRLAQASGFQVRPYLNCFSWLIPCSPGIAYLAARVICRL